MLRIVLFLAAADMDMAPSTLTRKLNPSDGDTQRLNLDDFEAWLVSTGEAAAAVEYLELGFKLGLVADDADALQRVAEEAERLGDEFKEIGDAPTAEECWFVASECYVELGDEEGRTRVLGLGRELSR